MLQHVPLLSAVDLHKTYRKSAERVEVLRGLDLEVYESEFVSVRPSAVPRPAPTAPSSSP